MTTPGKGSDFCSISPNPNALARLSLDSKTDTKMKKLITNIMELLSRIFRFDPDDEILDDPNDR